VLDRVFFPMHIQGEYVEVMRERPLFSDVYLIPFDFGPFGTLQSSLRTLVLNILLTVPFGFGISFIAPVRPKTMFWLIPVAGVSLELAQLILTVLLQYPYRIVDIHDVLMNTIGVTVGYGLFSLFALGYLGLTNWLNITHRGLSRYVLDVSLRSSPVTVSSSSSG
jgi:glycopeptide antibiotics resistance protein